MSVKLLEMVVIPYGYYVMRPNKICQILFYVSMLDYVHNIVAYAALYLGNIYVGFDTSALWGM